MRKPTPEDRDDFQRRMEAGAAARREMQEIINRVDARIRERRQRRERGNWLRRLLRTRRIAA